MLKVRGLNTSGEYDVSAPYGSNMLEVLKTNSYWSELSNDISGAIVIGSPTWDLFIKSYNMKKGTNITSYGGYNSYDSSEDLYFLSNMNYWLATDGVTYRAIVVRGEGYTGDSLYNVSGYGIRPVVALPATTEIGFINEIWKVF